MYNALCYVQNALHYVQNALRYIEFSAVRMIFVWGAIRFVVQTWWLWSAVVAEKFWG